MAALEFIQHQAKHIDSQTVQCRYDRAYCLTAGFTRASHYENTIHATCQLQRLGEPEKRRSIDDHQVVLLSGLFQKGIDTGPDQVGSASRRRSRRKDIEIGNTL